MPIGIYERKKYPVVCSVCETTFIVKQIKGDVCKKCQKKMHCKTYYKKHKEERKEKSRIYGKENKDKIKEKSKIYYEENKEKYAEYQKEYYIKNKDKLLKHYERKRREKGVKKNGLTGTESIAMDKIKEMFPNIEIRQNDRKTIKNPNGYYLELDFYMPDINLAIELNGITHYKPIYGTEKYERQQRNDEVKRMECYRLGITLVEIPLSNGKHYDRYIKEKEDLFTLLEYYLLKYQKRTKDELYD